MPTNLKQLALVPLSVGALVTFAAIVGSAQSRADPIPGPDSCDGVVHETLPHGEIVDRCVPQGPQEPEPEKPMNTTASVVGDVDVYNAKNEPDGAGRVVGILRAGQQVGLVGTCAPSSWCQVSGDTVPGGVGWVWGHLQTALVSKGR